MLETLLKMKRAHGSRAEARAAALIVRNYAQHLYSIDAAGNLLFIVGYSTTLFTAHIDTAHRDGGTNLIHKVGDNYYAGVGPLGADDAAGIKILCHMMEHKVQGHYLFTRGEEVGGIGARYFAQNMPFDYERAIAFDRKGYDSVITHQMGVQSCTNNFARNLARQLGMGYKPDSTGIYTDTAEFIGQIPQCTNISVGYFNEHTDTEWLDMSHLNKLKDAVLKVNWSKL